MAKGNGTGILQGEGALLARVEAGVGKDQLVGGAVLKKFNAPILKAACVKGNVKAGVRSEGCRHSLVSRVAYADAGHKLLVSQRVGDGELKVKGVLSKSVGI